MTSKIVRFPRVAVIPADSDVSLHIKKYSTLGFTEILLTKPDVWTDIGSSQLKTIVNDTRKASLRLWLELSFGDMPAARPLDPRKDDIVRKRAVPRFDHDLDCWIASAKPLIDSGIGGFLVRRPDAVPASLLRRIVSDIHGFNPDVTVVADTIGISWDASKSLEICGFDYCLSSLSWWDGRASWFLQENAVFSGIAPVIAQIGDFDAHDPLPKLDPATLVKLASAMGLGWLISFPSGKSMRAEDADRFKQLAKDANDLPDAEFALHKKPIFRALTGPGAPVTAILRSDSDDGGAAQTASIILVNPSKTEKAASSAAILSRTHTDMTFENPASAANFALPLDPGEVRIVKVKQAKRIGSSRPKSNGLAAMAAIAASTAPRIVIQDFTPSALSHPAKSTIGQSLTVEADIFTDGHEQLAVELLFKAGDAKQWLRSAMVPVGNDRWRASAVPERLGRHDFMIEAWLDIWGGFVRDFAKKREAGLDLGLEIDEGVALIRAALARSEKRIAARLSAFLKPIETADEEAQSSLLLSEGLRRAMRDADDRRFLISSPVHKVEVERLAARFASWYELFPRSVTDDARRPGRLLDVIERLPAIRKMGFDVLYFPPIHPIGAKNRKGPNNSLIAEPDDPGSPYAIGSQAGGHDAVHPDLGTLEDFQTLVAAARAQGLEIALDFAVQCSPDHPWLKDHPGWFAWRADGSMKYAENPPKKYEDIVNVDFYAQAAIPDLWIALRDVVLFWVSQGIRIFRVDNPHTKPFAFWEWMIGEVRGAHPDVIFLAEAFTRPKVMHHLARIGFSQSYSYFTWRNTKAELTDYLTELNRSPARDFFRPHFFVNTPDINPYFLQQSGRAGFLIRAALAATLSGLWGLYSGFELCEFEPMPGKEEYKNSEKYEIRPRDWKKPGNIVAEITRLNQIRQAEPALQSHLGVTFYNAFDDRILYYGKSAAGQSDKILIAVNLDPHKTRECDFEVPLWEWGLPDDAEVDVFDLLSGAHFIWRGKIQHMRLTQQAPYAIWRVQPRSEI